MQLDTACKQPWIFIISIISSAGHSKAGKEIMAPMPEKSAELVCFMQHTVALSFCPGIMFPAALSFPKRLMHITDDSF